jgi:uncharacterized cupredoxin-like copper-binding protein
MRQRGDKMSEQKISTRARVLAIPAIGAMALGVAVFSRNSSAQDATGTPVASPAASPAAGGTNLAVSTKDIFFDPKTLEGTANVDVTITVTNMGAATHDFTIDELKVQTPMLAPGETAEVKINAPAGDYQYYCSVPGHKEAGMVGTLTLKDASASASTPAASGSGAIEVTANDIYFDPKTLEGAANTDVVINITNKGAATHDFAIKDLNILTDMLQPGASASVTVNAPAGDYQYECTVPGHAEAGMVGTLTLK